MILLTVLIKRISYQLLYNLIKMKCFYVNVTANNRHSLEAENG